jgi:long-chain acyl-CoA synthetase
MPSWTWRAASAPALRDGKGVGAFDRLMYAIGNVMVYGPLRNNLGMSRVRVAYTAGEAIGPDLFTFYRSIGVNLKQLYGSTETAVFVCMQPDNQVHADTVGIPCRDVEIKLTDSGEILVRVAGPAEGVLQEPAGHRRGEGRRGLVPHGRRRLHECPRALEDHRPRQGRGAAGRRLDVRAQVHREQAQVLPAHQGSRGGGRPARDGLRDGQHRLRRGGQLGREAQPAVCAATPTWRRSPRCYALVKDCIEKVNADLAADEKLAGSQIARFLVLHKELDADDDELTRTRKVRRGFIAEKYRVLVDALYGGKTEQYIETQVKFEDGRTGVVNATLKIVEAKTYPTLKAAA